MTSGPPRRSGTGRGRRIAMIVGGIGLVYVIAVGAVVLLQRPGLVTGQQTSVLFAVGDLGGPQSRPAADLVSMLAQHRMDGLLLLGDMAAPDGSEAAWQDAYQPVFGQLDTKVRPTPGEIEYAQRSAAPYFSYFDARTSSFANAPYYAFSLGDWRIYSLNSEIDQSRPGSEMYEWLRNDLTSTEAGCVAAFWHTPVRTAGPGELDAASMGPIQSLLAARGADIVLTAHDQNYQRWAPTDGITSFVVGSGGAGSQTVTRSDDQLRVSEAPPAGALELDLRSGGADYQFITTDGSIPDSGSIRCHGRPSGELPRPATPSGLATIPGPKGVKLTWTPVTGDPAPIGYLVYRGSDPIGFTEASAFTDTDLPPGASVLYTVRSVASTGARSLPSTPVHSGGSAPGYTDYAWSSPDQNPSAATEDKPQSKLWFNDGAWWGILWGPDPARSTRSGYFIQRFDPDAQDWANTGVLVDERNRSHADALWDPATDNLYVASTIDSGGIKLFRFSYADGAYTPDNGFPVRLTEDGSESVTIAKDSKGVLWVTMTQLPDGSGACVTGEQCLVRVMHSTTAEWDWTEPYEVPVDGAAVTPDDISAVLSFGGHSIGVAWSNQALGAFLFAIHPDGASDQAWTVETVEVAPRGSDDHLNVKADGAGRVYLIGKTSLNDPANASPKSPLMELWVREANGSWRAAPVWAVEDDVTRPQIVVDESAGRVYAIAAQPGTGGSIYFKAASIADLVFPEGLGTVLLSSADMNNPTTTKQTVRLSDGILVLAGDTRTRTYWHNMITKGLAGAGS